MVKKRLDLLLVERGYFPSREQARAAIMAAGVLVNDVPLDKPGTLVREDAAIRITSTPAPYVGRGGLKLEKALKTFNISLENKSVLDIGASTGGFTDCALQHGAKKVYAVDVGYGQLAWELRQDPRVTVMERTNARYLKPDLLSEQADFCVIDVSFISLLKILPAACRCLQPWGEIIALVKPQFEAGPGRVGKKGVVRDAEVHTDVLLDVIQGVSAQGLGIKGLTYSPVRGGQGNIEYLMWITMNYEDGNPGSYHDMVENAVSKAHSELK